MHRDSAPSILWFRQDLRLADNPALCAAMARGAPVLPVYILDDETPGRWAAGGAGRWWLHRSLTSLAADLEGLGRPLVLRRGPAERVLLELAAELGAGAVYWNRCYEPFAIARDTRIKTALQARGLTAESGNAALLFEPWLPQTKSGGPFKVFTPFWRHLLGRPAAPRPLPRPEALPNGTEARGESLEDWSLLPHAPDWAGGLRDSWTPGEAGAKARLEAFLDDAVGDYQAQRDLLDSPGTSRLSPHLHWGEISPRQIWHATRHRAAASGLDPASSEAFLRELGWREFSYHLLYHWPELPERNWKSGFDAFPWREDEAAYRAWTRGRTGYPLVDAGLRELWATGWMHNRVRMVAASFLIKHLLIHWRRGEAWFWDTLVDADLASNSASWQWVAGSGADAAPFFRIFNPVTQSRKFDPEGGYLRRWLPELAKLPAAAIHAPWEADAGTLAAAGVDLGETYPRPIVDHAAARKRALAALETIKAER